MGDEPKPMKPAVTEQSVFAEALQRSSPEARAAYLDGACGTDNTLRGRVEALLRATEYAGDFLEQPPTGLAADDKSTMLVTFPSEQPGDRIGRYKILQQIGEGGCGVVYMAEQEEPVRRRVALKVIKLGMDTKSVIARFEAERQALALMDHPNIAKVLDAGTTDKGRPYFVMELVRGIKITDYCDENNLPTEDRLKLFTQVCQAIQHAHQKGIIHRDIKPSNILVTVSEPGAPGCPKVIDFGIAKATTGQRLTDKTVFTAFEQFIGTPAYMSPEQAMMTSLDIDTRTDIYALGVLLYELLTGQTPFDAKNLMAVGLDAMRRIIREEEPARPSTRLSTMLAADLTNLAKHRQAEPAKLGSRLRGDLDWIAMKCLEKDRARRYETANGLALDIQRHLGNEAVTARPPSAGYRFQKIVSRHKTAVTVTAVLAITLLLGLAGTTTMFVKAQSAQKKAASEAAIAEAVNQFLQEDILKQSRSRMNYRWRINLDTPPTVVEVLDRANLEVANRFKDQPLVEAAIRQTIGSAYANLGRASNAVPQLQRAFTLRKTLLGSNDPGTLDTIKELALAFAYSGDYTNALGLLEEYLPIEQQAFGAKDSRILELRAILAETRWKADRSPTNRPMLENTRKLLKQELPGDDTAYMECVFWLAAAYKQERRESESIPLQEELLTLVKQRHGALHPAVFLETFWLATSYENVGKFPESVEQWRQAVALAKQLFGEDDIQTLDALGHLGQTLIKCGRAQEALELFQKILADKEATLPPDHQEMLKFRQKLGWCYLQVNQTEKGIKILEETLQMQLKTLGTNNVDTHWTMGDLAAAYHSLGKAAEAIPLYEADLPLMKSELGVGNEHTQWLVGGLTRAYFETGRAKDALPLCETNLAALESQLPRENPAVLAARHWVGQCYGRLNRRAEAIRIFEEVLPLQSAKLASDDPEIYWTMGDLAFNYQEDGRVEEAIPLLEKNFAFQKNHLGLTNGYTRFVADRLLAAYDNTHREKEVDSLRREISVLATVKTQPNQTQ
ncbi:MAG: serine/threonine-protein kinase [Limisphaerales bacterium]